MSIAAISNEIRTQPTNVSRKDKSFEAMKFRSAGSSGRFLNHWTHNDLPWLLSAVTNLRGFWWDRKVCIHQVPCQSAVHVNRLTSHSEEEAPPASELKCGSWCSKLGEQNYISLASEVYDGMETCVSQQSKRRQGKAIHYFFYCTSFSLDLVVYFLNYKRLPKDSFLLSIWSYCGSSFSLSSFLWEAWN